jgi:sporulation protein YtfJ
MAHPIEGLMNTALSNIKDMIDVDTIVGNPIPAGDGIVIIPVSKVAFGFGAGGSNFGTPTENIDKQAFGGGAGAGVSISPVAFLVVSNNTVRLLPVSQTSAIDKIIDMAPDVIENVMKKFSEAKDKVVSFDEKQTVNSEDDFVIG